jgi:hypothetical protein
MSVPTPPTGYFGLAMLTRFAAGQSRLADNAYQELVGLANSGRIPLKVLPHCEHDPCFVEVASFMALSPHRLSGSMSQNLLRRFQMHLGAPA